jgi:hypothetical protein
MSEHVANLEIASVPDFSKASVIVEHLKQYKDTDTLIVDIWGPDIVIGYVKHALEEDITPDMANSILEMVTEQFEQGFLPVNAEILHMVDEVARENIDDLKQNEQEITNEPK